MTIREIFDGVASARRDIEETPAGAPELAATVARIAELRRELERTQSALGPLIPDAASPQTIEEKTAAELACTLVNLMKAARSKQDLTSGE